MYIYISSLVTGSTATFKSVFADVSWADEHLQVEFLKYGVATISRLLKIIGLFCKRAL